jgi:TatA/E family protein of Tat protein translocase
MLESDPHSSEASMPFNVGPFELVIVLVIALLVVGPKRLPEMGNSLGKTIREFRKASTDVTEAVSLEPEAQPATAAQPVAPATAVAPAPAVVSAPVAEAPALAPAADPAVAAATTAAPEQPPEAAPAVEPKSDDA